MLIFFPVGGLANRMRVIDSAVSFCERFNLNYRIIWHKDNNLYCAFSTIWKSINNLKDSNSILLPLLFKFRRKLKLFRILLLLLEKLHFLKVFSEEEHKMLYSFFSQSNVSEFCLILIASYSRFFPSDKFNTELFILKSELERRINEESDNFNEFTIGVHIRRNDNIDSIQFSPLELFINEMQKLLIIQSKTRFYLATDSEVVKKELIKVFDNKIISSSGLLSRNTEEGIMQSAVELYLLSRTSKILGSFNSSFSEMASILGGIELQIVKIDHVQCNNSLV